jgi:serpin B
MPSTLDLESAHLVSAANAEFGWDMYRHLAGLSSENLALSPFSIGVAMAMAYAGARGETASELAEVLHFAGPGDDLHPGYNALHLALTAPAETDDASDFTLTPANSVWTQAGYPFEPAYLDLLAQYYGAGAWQVDFAKETEAARTQINDWVEEHTNDRIQDLLPGGSLTNLTRLVLANAVYFKADWLQPFHPGFTRPAPFHRADGTTVDVPMMRLKAGWRYASVSDAGGDVAAVELPYAGEKASMLILLPEEGRIAELEAGAAQVLDRVIAALKPNHLPVTIPKWEFTSSFALVDAFRALGAAVAFDPVRADFSGIDGTRDIYISRVEHKAFIAVDEMGTEASAATGVVGETQSGTLVTFYADRPFLFVIRHIETGAVLFAGRVMDPSA